MKKLIFSIGLLCSLALYVKAQDDNVQVTTTQVVKTDDDMRYSEYIPGGLFGIRYMPVFTSLSFKKAEGGEEARLG